MRYMEYYSMRNYSLSGDARKSSIFYDAVKNRKYASLLAIIRLTHCDTRKIFSRKMT